MIGTRLDPWWGASELRAVAGQMPVGFLASILLRIAHDHDQPAVDSMPKPDRAITIEVEALLRGDVGFLLLDVRPKNQFDDDHIGGAQNVPLDSPQFIADVSCRAGGKGRHIVVYCSGPGCDAAGRAADRLLGAGYTNVASYDGGLHAWRRRAFAGPVAGTEVAP